MNYTFKHLCPTRSGRLLNITTLIGIIILSGISAYAGPDDTWQKTVWSEKSELFMKYDPPVAGKLGGFLLQLTRLDTFKPLSDGKVTLRLTAPGGKTVSQPMKFTGRPGIFKGTIAPSQAGLNHFSLQIAGADYNDEIAYEGVTVSPRGEKPSEGNHQAPPASPDVLISFLKEQQWLVGFSVILPEKRNMPPILTVSGELATNPLAEAIISAPLTGMIAFDKPIAHPGQRVAKGEEICHIEPPISQDGGADQLSAQVAEARNRALLARKELDRAKRLVEGGAAPRKRLEEAEIMLEIAQTNLAPLQRALGRVKSAASCGHIILKAPIDGTVVEVNVANGAYTQAGQQIAKIVDTSRLWLKANVPVSEITHSDHLASAYFTVTGNSQEFKPSRLITVSDVVDPKTRTVQTIFEVENPESQLKIGMFASVFLQNGYEESHTALAIPHSAVFEDEGKHFVYVQVGGETFTRREVTLGNRGSGLIAVAQGIAATDRVVTEGGYYVKQASQSSNTPEGHGHEH